MELHGDVEAEMLADVVKQFVGKIYQKPPLRSSVKRRLRVKEVYELEILEVRGRYVLFRALVESGTYIRKLCHDIGLLLGVEAHMRELRRTAVGFFNEKLNLRTLHELSEALYLLKAKGREDLLRSVIMPGEIMVAHLPKILVSDGAVDAIARGAKLMAPGVVAFTEPFSRGDLVAVHTLKGELVALMRIEVESEELKSMDRGVVAIPVRVVMKPGVYPSMWKKPKPEEAPTSDQTSG